MIYDEKKDEMRKVGLSWVACCEANDLLACFRGGVCFNEQMGGILEFTRLHRVMG
jgi:hypothetical protein